MHITVTGSAHTSSRIAACLTGILGEQQGREGSSISITISILLHWLLALVGVDETRDAICNLQSTIYNRQ